MAASSNFEKNSLTLHQIDSHLSSDSLAGKGKRYDKDGLQTIAKPPTLRPPPARTRLAALVAASVVIFIAYLCSIFTEKRVILSSFSRRLADTSGVSAGDLSDRCSSGSLQGTSPDTTPDLPKIASSPVKTKELTPDPDRQTTSSKSFPSVEVPGESADQLVTNNEQINFKRKAVEETKDGIQPKKTRLETPLEEPSLIPPPLDPETDALIDSVLSGGGKFLSEDFWVQDPTPLPDPAHHLEPPKRPNDHGVNVEEASRQHVGGLAQGVSPEVLENSPHLEKKWFTSAYQPMTFEHALPGGVVGAFSNYRGHLGRDRGGIVPSSMMPSALAREVGRSNTVGSSSSSSANMLGDQKHTGQASQLEGSLNDYSGDDTNTFQVPRELKQSPANNTREQPEGNVITSSDNSLPRSILSSSFATNAVKELPSGITGTVSSASQKRQYRSPLPLYMQRRILIFFRLLESMYRGISDEVLESHPFYRHPGRQPQMSTKLFRLSIAVTFRQVKQAPISTMAQCREILKNKSLTVEEFEMLVHHVERVFGHATGSMHIGAAQPALKAVALLGHIFLVVDMLYCAAEVLGENSRKNVWWPEVMHRIEGSRYYLPRMPDFSESPSWITGMACALNTALDYYRRGLRPPARLVVGLKEKLFCDPAIKKFQIVSWDPWRTDAADWRRWVTNRKQAGGEETGDSAGRS